MRNTELAISGEVNVYSSDLGHVQGKAVLLFYGLYTGETDSMISVVYILLKDW